ncbi:MAG: ribosomal protein L7/L12, partial [Roseburia sp.]|nr:ribosomal protein L7/L12 [Roseburia sp.]
EVVDGAPKVIKEGASKDEAEDIKTKVEAEGAKVTLK